MSSSSRSTTLIPSVAFEVAEHDEHVDQLISVQQDTMTGLIGDWRPFLYGGIGSVVAEFGKFCRDYLGTSLILFLESGD